VSAERWQQVATAFAAEAGDASSGRLCAVCIEVLGVDGAGITLMDGNQVGPLCVTGRGAAELEEMQFTLGEGPCHDAFRSGQPVLVTRLDHGAPIRWLPFAELAIRLGIGAVFAYPLEHDDVRLGVLTVYQRTPGPLSEEQLEVCTALSIVLAETISSMSHPSPFGESASGIDDAIEYRAEVHQASGVVAAQLHISATLALVRIRAHAFATDTAVKVIADDIIAHRLHLNNDHGGEGTDVSP
jgi:transcriptional regulator with GAF, ATPase, and Fis domain